MNNQASSCRGLGSPYIHAICREIDRLAAKKKYLCTGFVHADGAPRLGQDQRVSNAIRFSHSFCLSGSWLRRFTYSFGISPHFGYLARRL
jgi:hypothetical protein